MRSILFDRETTIYESPESALERMLIDEYLKEKGIASMGELCQLSREQAKRLMQEACRHAALKLAEVESVDNFQKELHVAG